MMRACASRRLCWRRRGAFHSHSDAERPHVGPHLFNVGEALSFSSALADVFPTRRVFPLRRPNRILFFVIHHYSVDGRLFFFPRHERALPPILRQFCQIVNNYLSRPGRFRCSGLFFFSRSASYISAESSKWMAGRSGEFKSTS